MTRLTLQQPSVAGTPLWVARSPGFARGLTPRCRPRAEDREDMAEAETAPSLEARNEPKGLGKIPLGSLTERNKKRGILLELRGAGNLGSATDKPPAMRQQARGRLLRAGGFQRPAPAREAWRSGLPDVASGRGARPRLQRHPSSSHSDGWPPKGRVMRRCRYAHLHPLDADAPPPNPRRSRTLCIDLGTVRLGKPIAGGLVGVFFFLLIFCIEFN